MKRIYTVVLVAGGFFALCITGSAEPTAAADAELPKFSFGGPEVLKSGWSTRSLTVADVNGNGLNDLALIDNDTSRIEILYQQSEGKAGGFGKRRLNRNRWSPILEDARFQSEGVTVGFPAFDLALGDLNGDGRVDLAYTGREVPLTLRFQSESGGWTEIREFRNFEALGWPETLKVVDLDDDGRAELVMISADAVRVFAQDDSGTLGEPKTHPVTGENPFNLIVEDVTGDGRKDILYITASGKQSLALREQHADGTFGPERRFVFERPVRSLRVMPGAGESGEVLFGAVNSRSGGLEFFRLKQASLEDATAAFKEMRPDIYPLFKKGRQSAASATGDINGDGQMDLVVANPAGAELLLFEKADERFQAPGRFPAFSGVTSVASGRLFEGKEDAVVVLSPSEKTLGVSRMEDTGRLSFPRQIVVGEGDPLVCEVLDVDGDGYDELVLIQERTGSMYLSVVRPVDRAAKDPEWEVLSTVQLEGMHRKPASVAVVDLFGAGRTGLMVFVPRESPALLVAESEAPYDFREIARNSSIRESLLKGVVRSQVSVVDLEGDGVNELLVGRTGYARAIRVVGDGLEMVDQFNARRSEDVVTAVVPIFESGVLAQLVFYVSGVGEFQFLERNEDGVFRYRSATEAGDIDLVYWASMERAEGPTEYLFAGEDRFWFLSARAEGRVLSAEDTHETELEGVRFSHVDGADFDGDGRLDLVAVDGARHVVEILTRDESEWHSRMYWEIFEQSLHYQGRTGGNIEPRQLLIADVTGDGKLDFVFLVHDRVLFYPQL